MCRRHSPGRFWLLAWLFVRPFDTYIRGNIAPGIYTSAKYKIILINNLSTEHPQNRTIGYIERSRMRLETDDLSLLNGWWIFYTFDIEKHDSLSGIQSTHLHGQIFKTVCHPGEYEISPYITTSQRGTVANLMRHSPTYRIIGFERTNVEAGPCLESYFNKSNQVFGSRLKPFYDPPSINSGYIDEFNQSRLESVWILG